MRINSLQMNDIDRQKKLETDFPPGWHPALLPKPRICPSERLQTGTEFAGGRTETAGGSDPSGTTRLEGSRKSETAPVWNTSVIDQPRKTRFDYAGSVVQQDQPGRI